MTNSVIPSIADTNTTTLPAWLLFITTTDIKLHVANVDITIHLLNLSKSRPSHRVLVPFVFEKRYNILLKHIWEDTDPYKSIDHYHNLCVKQITNIIKSTATDVRFSVMIVY